MHNEGDTRPGSDNSNLAFEEFELYDLVDDPGETKNIAAQHPAILKEMKTGLEAFVLSCERSNRGEDYK